MAGQAARGRGTGIFHVNSHGQDGHAATWTAGILPAKAGAGRSREGVRDARTTTLFSLSRRIKELAHRLVKLRRLAHHGNMTGAVDHNHL